MLKAKYCRLAVESHMNHAVKLFLNHNCVLLLRRLAWKHSFYAQQKPMIAMVWDSFWNNLWAWSQCCRYPLENDPNLFRRKVHASCGQNFRWKCHDSNRPGSCSEWMYLWFPFSQNPAEHSNHASFKSSSSKAFLFHSNNSINQS